ncbi:MAG TPA: hypothetical protein VGQ20_00410 [Acidimicrobiales bacterium]|jgi:hypothetical protein|nr:hypothetical protein [Acidimicrobiales bacterium]
MSARWILFTAGATMLGGAGIWRAVAVAVLRSSRRRGLEAAQPDVRLAAAAAATDDMTHQAPYLLDLAKNEPEAHVREALARAIIQRMNWEPNRRPAGLALHLWALSKQWKSRL